jgi:Single-strand binding protein family
VDPYSAAERPGRATRLTDRDGERDVLDRPATADPSGDRALVWRAAERQQLHAALAEGTAVLVSGRAAQRTWEAKDGTKRRSIEITCRPVGHRESRRLLRRAAVLIAERASAGHGVLTRA